MKNSDEIPPCPECGAILKYIMGTRGGEYVPCMYCDCGYSEEFWELMKQTKEPKP